MQRSQYKGERSYSWVTNYILGSRVIFITAVALVFVYKILSTPSITHTFLHFASKPIEPKSSSALPQNNIHRHTCYCSCIVIFFKNSTNSVNSVNVLLMFSGCSQDVCRIFPGCSQEAPMGLVSLVEFDDHFN